MKMALGIIVGLILGVLVFSGGTAFIMINNVVPSVQKALAKTNTEKQPSLTNISPNTSLPKQTSNTNTNPNPAPTQAIPITTIPQQNADSTDGNFQISDGNIGLQINIVSVEGTGFTRTVTGKVINNGSVTLHNTQLEVELFSNGKQLNFNNGQPSWQKSYGTLAAGSALTDQITLTLSLLDGLTATKYGVEIHMTLISTEKSQTFVYQYSLN